MPANIITVNGKEYILPDSRMPLLMRILYQYADHGEDSYSISPEVIDNYRRKAIIRYDEIKKVVERQ